MLDIQTRHKLLYEHFNYREFLEGQEPVIESILTGEDVVVIMPTGGGKSLCYQFPAIAMEGLTLVISPLIALMKDQVDGLRRKKIAATYINSSLPQAEMNERIEAMVRGEYRLVYVAPERFKSDRFLRALAPLSIALFAVDEAHCISQWGHDFRPDYLQLKRVLKELGQPQVAALTATATPDVRDDIARQLELGQNGRKPPRFSVAGFARHNLTLNVIETGTKDEKLRRIEKIIKEQKTGVVYCSTRKNVEKVRDHLNLQGIGCVAYHAGMNEELRTQAQDQFMSGKRAVVVATNAFGMGVDRSDVRFVVHFDIPGSVEAYYQEAGRAGRDGEPSICALLYNFADVRTQEFFIDGANPTREIIADTYETLKELCANGPIEMSIEDIAERVEEAGNDMAVGSSLILLERVGAIRREFRPGSRVYTTTLNDPAKELSAFAIDFAALKAKRERDLAKLRRMIDYAQNQSCRHMFILNYFGEQSSGKCAACDYCLERARKQEERATAGAGAGSAKSIQDETTVLLQKALSCVARMKGKFGLGRIALVLTGSKSREVFDAKLDKLSTYGLLKDYGYNFTTELLRRLVNAGCIEVIGEEYPKAALTARGIEVMQARMFIEIELPEYERLPAKAAKSAEVNKVMQEAPYDQRLFEELRKWRRQKAQSMNVPAFVIYPDSTLKELSRSKPSNTAALMNVRGIGPAKADQYGVETLAIISGSAPADETRA